MKKRLIIAIDGPAASGKSTTARLLAQKLGYVYLDTGAMYRACALKAERLGIDLSQKDEIAAMLDALDIEVVLSGHQNTVFLDREDVNEAIRTHEISRLASDISAIPAVRYKMVELQRRIANNGGVVLDGRDIGSFVFPDAEIKFFMVAPPEVRALRRFKELQAKGIETDLDTVLKELNKRDLNDSSRALAPLVRTSDAIEIDTGCLTIEEQVEALYEHVLERLGV
ncbi:MAG: (d)CMP kinase [Candidatus Cloacimonadaceae bacterium]|nr:(d)CMP kinase [Candidatus Cloacimonadaceae bacterium]MDP3113402.1 (d)CMP kinase [Candidatus Cloacimonadaceae bacterium]